MRFTVLRLVKLFHVRFVTTNISLHYSKLYAYNTSMGSDSKFNVLDASTLFFLFFFFFVFLKAQNTVRVIEGKIIEK